MRLFALVGLLAITLASLIPQGWMPTIGGDDRMLLVICTGDGTVERWVGGDDDPVPPHDSEDERMSCAFAGVGAPALLPDFAAIEHLPQGLGERWRHARFTHHSAGFFARYDARAPPALS
ncbi:MAG: DUF2946 domain-containing protein [Marinibacterium sp.]|nr:DUF2946 domain-containing protein [Marinibacterium sp.]